MEDSENNYTLFLAVAREAANPDPEKVRVITSLVFITRNIPAALYKAMGGFATNRINLLKLESYIPIWTRGSAQFFITFEGHPGEPHIRIALEELHFFCEDVKMLGSYPADPMRFK
jgi:prephenate dehydratase